MPYHVAEKGSYGCSGYPVVKDGTSEVMGCHDTEAAARNQITAINMSEAESSKKRLSSGMQGSIPAAAGPSVLDGEEYEEKDTITNEGGVGIKNPQAWPGTRISEEERRRRKEQGMWSGSFSPRLRQKSNYNDNSGDWYNAKPIPETSAFQDEVETRNNIIREIGKEHMEIKEGDFVMGETIEGIVHGRVEHIMWEGGVLGSPEGEYSIESMPPENPAMSVRIYEEEDEGYWEETAYSIGMMYQDAQVLEDLQGHTMPEMPEGGNPNMENVYAMAKAETYTPNDGMKAAARRAIKWKEDGKAKGAGTAVGWGRARDIVAGRSMSLSVVKRMYSFFSRHEVDKKAKGFRSGEEGYPSKGRVMWDAWGGDAGFSWSRKIAQRNEDKALFAEFGRDLTKAERFVVKAESVRVGQMVSWNSSGGTARGKVKRVIRSGSYDVPGTDITINATEEDPAVVITLYRDGDATDTIVAHRMSTLRAS
jgi:hypothetical protein